MEPIYANKRGALTPSRPQPKKFSSCRMNTASILLVTDDTERDHGLRDLLALCGPCNAVRIEDVADRFPGSETLILVKGKTKSTHEAAELRRFLSASSSATPVVWLVHGRSRAETARAHALGANKVISDD